MINLVVVDTFISKLFGVFFLFKVVCLAWGLMSLLLSIFMAALFLTIYFFLLYCILSTYVLL